MLDPHAIIQSQARMQRPVILRISGEFQVGSFVGGPIREVNSLQNLTLSAKNIHSAIVIQAAVVGHC